MTVYIDVVLLENLCMNYIILFATGFILKLKMKQLKLALSALLGGIYAILTYMQILEIYSTMIMKIILSLCMIYIAFTPKNIKALLKELILFYLISFAFGGCAFALLYFLKPEDIFMINGVYIGSYPLKIALLGGVIGFVITYIAFKIVKNRMSKKGLIYLVKIQIEEKEIELKAMLDTGNMLRDPITGAPVIIVERENLYGVIPGNILNNIEKIIGGDWEEYEEEITYRSKFRIIPFQSIGKQNGMLLGFKVDQITIMTDIEDIKKENAIMCIYTQSIGKNNSYSALIGLDMLEGSDRNEYLTTVKR